MLIVLFVSLVFFPVSSFADITKIVIEKRETFANGQEFGVTGSYERSSAKRTAKSIRKSRAIRSLST